MNGYRKSETGLQARPNPLSVVGEEEPLAAAQTPVAVAQAVPQTPTADLYARAQGYALRAKSERTRVAYQSDWKHFAAWCELRRVISLPAAPETVSLYLTDHAETFKPSTLQRRLVAIAQVHKEAGVDPPTRAAEVRRVLSGICREQGTAPKQVSPLLIDDVKAMVRALPDSLQGKRDRAMLLIGWAGAFRRSEIVALNVADIVQTSQGMVVTLRRSKTDQEGAGRKVGIAVGATEETCPVQALKAWMEATAIKRGPLFRRVDRHGNVGPQRMTAHGLVWALKRMITKAGLDPVLYGGHSLRSGLATSAALAGSGERDIMKTTGHKSEKMVRRYIRDAELFRDNPAKRAGL